MVKIRELHPLEENGKVDIEAWLATVQEKQPFSTEQIDQLRAACHLSYGAEQARTESDKRWADASCFHTGLEMASILNELDQDAETLIAAILYRAVREERLSLEMVATEFGQGVANLIEGVLRMASVSALQSLSEERVLGRAAEVQVENLRKMLVAIIDDVRVALVKIAERTCAIRAVKNAPEEKRRRVAHEIMSVYAPLAHRLGIGHLKWELEDLAFRYLEADAYKHIARLLDERRLDRQQFITQARTQLGDALQEAGIQTLPAAQNISTVSGARCAPRVLVFPRCMTFVRSGFWCLLSRIVIPRWVLFMVYGAIFPMSLMITLPIRKTTAIDHCIRQ